MLSDAVGPLLRTPLKTLLALNLGLALMVTTVYLRWAGYVTMLPTSVACTDPAATAQTLLEPARWFLAHAPNLTLLVPLPNDENLAIPSP